MTADRFPDFVCIGGMRCGSTTLWDLLGRHPGIYLPDEKEMHFFDDAKGRFELGADWYANQFAAAGDLQLRGEVTPSYLHQEVVPPRMAAMLPDARLIVILRDPAKRAWSHYWFRVRQGREPLPFMQALERERNGISAPGDRWPLWRFAYLGWSRYIDGLRRFESAFGRNAIQVIFFEELLRDPAGVMRVVWEHIGAEPMDVGSPPRTNEMYSPRLRRMHIALKSRADAYVPGQAGYRRLERAVVRRLMSWNLRPGPRPLPPHVLGVLRERLKAPDEELAEWLGRSLPWQEG
jgi:hypothetical protein